MDILNDSKFKELLECDQPSEKYVSIHASVKHLLQHGDWPANVEPGWVTILKDNSDNEITIEQIIIWGLNVVADGYLSMVHSLLDNAK